MKMYHASTVMKNVALATLLAGFSGIPGRARGASPYPMSAGNYLEGFADIANWTANFASGIGAQYWGSVAVNTSGTIPDGQKTTVSTAAFSSGSTGGLQKGTGGLVFLSTGTTENSSALAVDLLLDFTGRNAGTLSFDWAEINNSTGSREASIKVFTSVDGATFAELPAAFVSVTNNMTASGSVLAVPLPDSFSGSATARIRFYNYNGGTPTTGASGSRPKISIGNISVTSTGTTVTPPAINGISPGNIITNAGNTVAFTVSASGDALSYFWYKRSGSGSNLIAGASAATLTLANVLQADAADYFVVVSNSASSAVSSNVALSVIDPAINAQPVAAQTKFLNAAATFSVTAAGTPALNYQWYQGTPDSAVPLSDGGRISGANAGTLTINALAYSDAGDYFVSVGNSFGTVTSAVSALLVTNFNTVARWDFNGSFNTLAPAPSSGSGSASLVGGISGASSGGSASDSANALGEGLANNGWQTSAYPTNNNPLNNKTAGVQFGASTLGLRNVKISFDVRNSNTGSKYLRLQYTTNGTDFIDHPAPVVFANPGNFETEFFDLSGLPGVRDNANFGFRIVSEYEVTANFGAGATNYVAASGTYSTAGTIRYDRVMLSAELITNANASPTLTGLADVATGDSTPLLLNFTVDDAETAADELAVSAVSANQTVIPNASLSLGGSGNGRTLTITPISGVEGFAPILVSVSDADGNVTTATINVTVTAGSSVNRMPLNFQTSAGNLILSWADASFSLQSATNALGPYSTIAGSTSPYTNAIKTGQMFFRLVH